MSETSTLVSYEDFAKLDIRVVRVRSAERIDKSGRYIKLTIFTGKEERTLVTEIGSHYDPDELVGQKIIMLLNLKPEKILGIESQGAVLVAEDSDVVSLLASEKDVREGSRVR